MRTKLSLLLILLCAFAVFAQQAGSPLTNADVIKMVKAGRPEAFILNAIANHDTQFDLSSTGLQALSQAGVGSKVIRAMLAAESKKKDAAAAAEASSTPAPDTTPAQDTSSAMSPQGMGPQGMPPGMSPDTMAQMDGQHASRDAGANAGIDGATQRKEKPGHGWRSGHVDSAARGRSGSSGQRALHLLYAATTAAATAAAHVETAKMLKMQKEMFSWKCQPAPPSVGPGGQSTTQLTDIHPIEDQIVDGRPAAANEFYAYENLKTQGPVRLLVAKDTGLPLRIDMGDPNTTGGVQMVYSQLDSPVNIEIPACMGGQ